MNVKQFLEQIRDDSMEDGNLWTAELAKTCIADLDAQSLELQELKEQRRDWLDKDITARTMVAQEKELQAVREALAECHRLIDFVANHSNARRLLTESCLDDMRAALKQSRGAT